MKVRISYLSPSRQVLTADYKCKSFSVAVGLFLKDNPTASIVEIDRIE